MEAPARAPLSRGRRNDLRREKGSFLHPPFCSSAPIVTPIAEPAVRQDAALEHRCFTPYLCLRIRVCVVGSPRLFPTLWRVGGQGRNEQ